MKNYKMLVPFAIILFCNVVGFSQNTYWVSNRNDGIYTDFTNLQTAINSVGVDDTLLIYSSPFNYGGITINKKIHLIGLGYFTGVAYQPSLEITTQPVGTLLTDINITSSASGGSISSIQLAGGIEFSEVNGFLIKRIQSGHLYLTNSNNINIRNSFLDGQNAYSLSFNNSSENIVENTVFNHYINTQYNIYSDNASINNVVGNNIFLGEAVVSNSMFYNNIFLNNNINGTGNLLSNNIFCFYDSSLNFNGNQYGINPASVFVGYPTQGSYSFDSRWQLQPISPAIGAGIDGIDCGVFGGQYPYKLSGIYNRPLIYELLAPLYVPVGSQLPVTIKVRAEN